MKNVLIVGAGKLGTTLLNMLITMKQYKVIAVVDRNPSAPGLSLARQHHIETGHDWKEWMNHTLDIVIDATNSKNTYRELVGNKPENLTVIPSTWSEMTVRLSEQKEKVIQKLTSSVSMKGQVMDHIPAGLIVVDGHEKITFINKNAKELIGEKQCDLISKPMRKVIEQSRLPEVIRSRNLETNKTITLKNGKRLITNHIPIVDDKNVLTGAFSSFCDVNEVIQLAQEMSGLKDMTKTLEAIFSSSDDAVSIVDEDGKGIMFNPAYKKLAELWQKDDIEESRHSYQIEKLKLHKKVLQTRQPIKGVRIQVGAMNKEVVVNVAPIIVDSKLKGSVAVLHDVSNVELLTTELKKARQIIRNLESSSTFDDIIGSSDELTLAVEQAKVGAKTSSIVLLRGEAGTGKELFAQAIHNESNRRHNKFIRVNCAQPDSILESELFGVEEMVESSENHFVRKGLLEEANQGTIFLDEISELSLTIQAKLLKAIEHDKFVRLGGTNPVGVDVRIITSTNRNLEKAVMNGNFLEALYYRLNQLPVFIPSLSDRPTDLTELVYHCVHKLNEYYGRNVRVMEKDVIEYFKQYHWPGNVRELEIIVSSAMIGMDIKEDRITLKHIPELPKINSNDNTLHDKQDPIWKGQSLQQSLDKHEKQVILTALTKHQFNKTKTAIALGISIRSLYYKMDKFKIAKGGVQ